MNQNHDDGAARMGKMKKSRCDSWENWPKFKISTILENTNFHCDSKSFFSDNGRDYSKYDEIAYVIKEKNSKIGQELESIRETLRQCSQLNETILCNENLEPPFQEVVNQASSKSQFARCRCNCQEVERNISAGDWQKRYDDLDRKEDLHEIARNLSTTLLELNSCKICKSFPEELKETVETLKSLLDYVNEKNSNTKLSVSRTENLKPVQSDVSQKEETIYEDADDGCSSKIIISNHSSHSSSHLNSIADPTSDVQNVQITSVKSVKSCQCNFPTNVGTQKDMEEKLTKETETEKNLEPSNHKITAYKQSPLPMVISSASNVFDKKSKEIVEEFLLEAISVFDKINNLDSMEEISAFSENEYGNQILNNLTKSELEQSFSSTSCISYFSSKISTRTNSKMKTEKDWKKINFQRSNNEIIEKPVENVDVRPELKFSIKRSEHFLKSKYKRKLKSSSIKSKSLTLLDAFQKIDASKYETKNEPKTKLAIQEALELKTQESNSKFQKNQSPEIKRRKSKKTKLKNESGAKPDKELPEVQIEQSKKVNKIQNDFAQPKKTHGELKNKGSLKVKTNNDEKIFKIVKLNSEDSRSLAQISNKPKSAIGLPSNAGIEDPHEGGEKHANVSKELDSGLGKPTKMKRRSKSGSKTISNEKIVVTPKFSAELEEVNPKTVKKCKIENTKVVETDFRANVIRTLNKSNKNVMNVLAKVNKNVKEALESANQNLKIVLDVALKQKIIKANLNKKIEESEQVMHSKEKGKKVASSNNRKYLDFESKECKVQTLSTIIKVQKYNNEDIYRFYRRQRRLFLFNPLETISDVDESVMADHAEKIVIPIEELKSPAKIKQNEEKIRESKRKHMTKRKRRCIVSKNSEIEFNVPNCNQQRDSSQVKVSNKPKSELELPNVSQSPIISSKPKYIPKTIKCQLFDEILTGKPFAETRNASLDTLADVVSITQYEVSNDMPEERRKEPEFEPELQEFENLNVDNIFGDSKIHPINCDCFDCLCKQYKQFNLKQDSNHSPNCCCLRCVEEIMRIKNKNLDRKHKTYFEQQFKNCKQTVEKLKKEVKQLGLASRMTIQNITTKCDIEQTFLAKSRSSIQLTLTGLKVALNCLQSNCNKNEHVISHIFKTKHLEQNSNIFNNVSMEPTQEKIPNRNLDNAVDQVRPVSRSETRVKQVSKNIIKKSEDCAKFASGNVRKFVSSEPNLGKIYCPNVRKMFDQNRKPKSPLRGKRSNRDVEIPNKFESEQYKLCNCEEVENNQSMSKLIKKKIIVPKYNAFWRPTTNKVQTSSMFKKKNLKVKRFAKLNRSPKFESKMSLKTSKSKKEFVADKIVSVKSTASECPKGLSQNELDTILGDLFQAIEEIENIKHTQHKSHTENTCTKNQTSLISLLNRKQPICAQNSKTKPNDLQFGSVFTTKIAPKLPRTKIGEENNSEKFFTGPQEIQKKKLSTSKIRTVDKSLAKHPYAESITALFDLCTNWENKFKKTLQQVKVQPKKTLNPSKSNNFAYSDLFPSKCNSTTPVQNKKVLPNRNQKIKV